MATYVVNARASETSNRTRSPVSSSSAAFVPSMHATITSPLTTGPHRWSATRAARSCLRFRSVQGQRRHRRRPGTAAETARRHSGSFAAPRLNWGYSVDSSQVRFAHWLIDAGIDPVYGHSSHHPRPVEVYRDKLILYGCGDLITDYEGIGLPGIPLRVAVALLRVGRPGSGGLITLRMVPFSGREGRSTEVISISPSALDHLCRSVQGPSGGSVSACSTT
jgi:Bacterial capsule synthesis protein PGA_cap